MASESMIIVEVKEWTNDYSSKNRVSRLLA